jgi:hypothetical protein
MPSAVVSTRVRGLTELIRAFDGIERDVVRELVDELAEAANPARREATTLMHEMVNVRPPYDSFRIGLSKGEKKVWIAPAWRTTGAFPPRPEMAPHIRKRMKKAVEHNRVAVIKKIREMCDRIADHHGF